MKTMDFSINRQYEIKCRSFTPDDERVEHIIIGVHGFAGDKDSSMLEKLALACSENAAALICFDFPAHGDSPVNEEMLTVENCKMDLYAVIDHAAEKYPNARKSIFATSYGGYIALLSAERLSDFSFVLRAPAVTMPKLLLETVLRTSEENFRKSRVIRCGFQRLLNLPYSFYEELMRQDSVCSRQLSSAIVIHGDRDDIVPLGDVEEFIRSQTNTELRIIHGADHRFKNRGEIEKVIEYTRDFLKI